MLLNGSARSIELSLFRSRGVTMDIFVRSYACKDIVGKYVNMRLSGV